MEIIDPQIFSELAQDKQLMYALALQDENGLFSAIAYHELLLEDTDNFDFMLSPKSI